MPRWLRLILRLLRGRWLPNPPPPDDSGPPGTLEATLNEYRAKAGLRPLIVSGCLQEQADEHSQWMEGHGDLTHAGMSTRLSVCKFAGGSENIAKGQRNDREVIADWDTSSGHRRNMRGDWTHVGGGLSGTYWTLLFGR